MVTSTGPCIYYGFAKNETEFLYSFTYITTALINTFEGSDFGEFYVELFGIALIGIQYSRACLIGCVFKDNTPLNSNNYYLIITEYSRMNECYIQEGLFIIFKFSHHSQIVRIC